MDLDADDVVGALQERLCIGVWRDDLIVADPFMKLASWQTRVSPALLTNVSNMCIVRGGRCSPVIQADMEEFRTIRARMRGRTARRAHHVGIALASLPWARRHPALLSRLISFLPVAKPGQPLSSGPPPPAHHHPAAKIDIFIDYARPWTSQAASVKLSVRLQCPTGDGTQENVRTFRRAQQNMATPLGIG